MSGRFALSVVGSTLVGVWTSAESAPASNRALFYTALALATAAMNYYSLAFTAPVALSGSAKKTYSFPPLFVSPLCFGVGLYVGCELLSRSILSHATADLGCCVIVFITQFIRLRVSSACDGDESSLLSRSRGLAYHIVAPACFVRLFWLEWTARVVVGRPIDAAAIAFPLTATQFLIALELCVCTLIWLYAYGSRLLVEPDYIVSAARARFVCTELIGRAVTGVTIGAGVWQLLRYSYGTRSDYALLWWWCGGVAFCLLPVLAIRATFAIVRSQQPKTKTVPYLTDELLNDSRIPHAGSADAFHEH